MFDKIKKWYQQGLWTEAMVANAVAKNVLTQEEYEAIVNGSSVEPRPNTREILNIIIGDENA